MSAIRFAPAFAGILTLLSVVISPIVTHAGNCDEDSITDVASDGETLIMLSGHVYRVDTGDAVDSSLWLPAEEVLVCEGSYGVEIINKDSSGEKVSAVLIK